MGDQLTERVRSLLKADPDRWWSKSDVAVELAVGEDEAEAALEAQCAPGVIFAEWISVPDSLVKSYRLRPNVKLP